MLKDQMRIASRLDRLLEHGKITRSEYLAKMQEIKPFLPSFLELKEEFRQAEEAESDEDTICLMRFILLSNPDDLDTILELGRFCVEASGAYLHEEGKELYTHALTLAPEHPHAHLGLAEIAALEEREEEAERLFQKARSLGPSDVRVMLSYLGFLSDKEPSEVGPFFQACLRDLPSFEERFQFLKAAFHQGHHDPAREGIERLSEENPEDPRLEIFRGRFFEQDGDFAKAEASYIRSFQKIPENAEAADDLFHLLIQMERFKEAYILLHGALLSFESPEALRSLARLVPEFDRTLKRRNYEKLYAKAPHDPDASLKLFSLLQAAGQTKEAKALFQKTLKHLETPDLLCFFAEGLEYEGEIAHAELALLHASKRFPEHPEILILLGLNFLVQNKLERAEHIFQKARLLDQTEWRSFYGLARVAFLRRRYKEAEALFRTSEALSPYLTTPRTGLAEALFKQGREAEAEDLYRGVLHEEPRNKEAYEGLLALLQKQERDEESEELEEAWKRRERGGFDYGDDSDEDEGEFEFKEDFDEEDLRALEEKVLALKGGASGT